MNTAEIAIEQLFAGILAIVACLLPFVATGPLFCLLDHGPFAVAFLGAAYAVGVVFDRVFDGILGGLEQWRRLEFAHERFESKRTPSAKAPEDWLPQAKIEAEVRDKDGSLAWMNHLRARLRMARSLAVAAPLVAVGVALSPIEIPTTCSGESLSSDAEWWSAAPAALLVLAFVLSRRAREIPRTDQVDHATFPLKVGARSADHVAARKELRVIAWAPLVVLYVGGSVVIAAALPGSLLPSVGLMVVGVVSATAWSRLLETYFKFVVSKEQAGHRNTGAGAA